MPNVKVITKDRAHAARRILSRPWCQGSNRIKVMLDMVFHHSGSIVKTIDNSDTFSSWLRAAIKLQQDRSGGDATGLHFAAHRFDSIQKPMARFTLHLDAVLAVAQRIAQDRRSEKMGKRAYLFLKFLTPEVVLQVAMLAGLRCFFLFVSRRMRAEGGDIS
eukprot:559685-Pyramimonas_sp.AAC.1